MHSGPAVDWESNVQAYFGTYFGGPVVKGYLEFVGRVMGMGAAWGKHDCQR